MRSLWSLLIVALCMASTVSTGAASPLPEPGTRIRLTSSTPARGWSYDFVQERWTGPLVSVAHDTVTMREGDVTGKLVAVPTQHVVRFEISRGDQPNGLRMAGVGLAIGALLGAGAGYAYGSGTYNEVLTPEVMAGTGAVILGVIGAAIGAKNGAGTRSERWRRLPLKHLRDAARP